MTQQEIKEQLQQDILTLLESYGINEALSPREWESLKDNVCDIIVTDLNKLI